MVVNENNIQVMSVLEGGQTSFNYGNIRWINIDLVNYNKCQRQNDLTNACKYMAIGIKLNVFSF